MDVIRGEPVGSAITKLRYSGKRASPLISKVLRSALANATQKVGATEEELVVWRAFVDGGPNIKGAYKTRAQGRMYPITRRTCHLSVVLKRMSPQPKKEKKEGQS